MNPNSSSPRTFNAASLVFAPVNPLLSRLRLGGKVALISGLLIAVIGALLAKSFLRSNEDIATTRAEVQGAAVAAQTKDLITEVLRHRGQTSLALKGNHEAQSARPATREAIGKLSAGLEGTSAALDMGPQWGLIKAEVQRVTGPQATQDAVLAVEEHAALMRKLYDFSLLAAEKSGLMLDPEANTFYLMSLAVERIYPYVEVATDIRTIGTLALQAGEWKATDTLNL